MEKELLTIEHLKKSFGDNVILDDVNLTVKQGEVIVIMDRVGAVKVPCFVVSMHLSQSRKVRSFWMGKRLSQRARI